MKRLYKNIICIVLIILLGGSIFLTGYLAKKNLETSTNNNTIPNKMEMNYFNENMTPPNMDNETPPVMEENNDLTPPEENENLTPPVEENNTNTAKKEKRERNKQTDENLEERNNNQEAERPNKNNQKESITPPNFTNNINQTNTKLTIGYYILFGIESLLISLLIAYLIISKFNKKTWKESLNNKDDMIIGILISLILTLSLTVGTSYIMNEHVLKSNPAINNFEPRNIMERREMIEK